MSQAHTTLAPAQVRATGRLWVGVTVLVGVWVGLGPRGGRLEWGQDAASMGSERRCRPGHVPAKTAMCLASGPGNAFTAACRHTPLHTRTARAAYRAKNRLLQCKLTGVGEPADREPGKASVESRKSLVCRRLDSSRKQPRREHERDADQTAHGGIIMRASVSDSPSMSCPVFSSLAA